jgi:poly-gamma-glutamate synthesis protein (capsule biosynthesis protein)
MAKETQVSLIAVGDIMLGDHPLYVGRGVGAKIKQKGPTFPFSEVASNLKEGDVIFGNLEAVLSNRGIDSKRLSSVSMRAAPEAVEGLTYAGFNILSLANNHILEHGEDAVSETMTILSRHDIKYVGVDTDITKAREPLIVDAKGIKIAFLAYCLIPDKTAYISINDPQEICSDVRKAKPQADVVVVSLHWGNEFMEKPSPSQVRLAHQIIDAGASVILGHHPHVLQGVETYKKGIIAYSLGNFIFDQIFLEETRYGVILECLLSKDGAVGYKLLPTYTDDEYVLHLLQGQAKEASLAELEALSSELMNETRAGRGEKERDYTERVEVLRNRVSRKTKGYFIRNLYRYPPRFAWQLAMGYLKKRLP